MKFLERYWLALLFVSIFLALISGYAFARPLSITNLCEGFTISQRGNDVLLRCPGDATPFMTFKGCTRPVVQRSKYSVTITCNWR